MLSRFTILQPDSPPAGQGKLILSFDDGPNTLSDVSERLMDVLDKHGARATFCYIGKQIEERPDIVKRAHTDGHTIAIHTYTHSLPPLLSDKLLTQEIEQSIEAIRKATGDHHYTPRLFRPPWGITTPSVKRVCKAMGLQLAYVSFFVNEAHSGSDKAAAKVAKIQREILRRNGAAIVMHEMCYNQYWKMRVDKDWLPDAVDKLLAETNLEVIDYPDVPA